MRNIFCILLVVVSFVSCKEKQLKRILNVEDTKEVTIVIQRFDLDLIEVDPDKIPESIDMLSKKYSDFYDLYNERIINIGSVGSKAYPEYLQRFVTDYTINMAFTEVKKSFSDPLNDIEMRLSNAFSLYATAFPDKKIPRFYTFIGGFNQSIVVNDSILAIGLDKYLGRNCDLYYRIGWSKYMINNMHREKIASDCMLAWAMTEYPFNDSIDNTVSRMLYYGKLHFFVKTMLPDEPDSIIMGFSTSQMRFCNKNEKMMWTYLIEQKLLFSSDQMTLVKFTQEGPFTKDFTKDSPGRAANWIGMRIIESYMKGKTINDLKSLMENENYQGILNASKYEP